VLLPVSAVKKSGYAFAPLDPPPFEWSDLRYAAEKPGNYMSGHGLPTWRAVRRCDPPGLVARGPSCRRAGTRSATPVSGPIAQSEGARSCCLRHTLHIPLCIQRRPPAPLIFWTALSERPGGVEFGCAEKPEETDTLPMNLLLLLALAVPLSCLAVLTLLALLAVVTLAGIIHVVGTLSARPPQWPLGREARVGVL
jgi:hypothetical protein